MSGMEAASYYESNALKHGEEVPISEVGRTGQLPAVPSQVDWAVLWLMESRKPPNRCLDIGCAQLHLLRSLQNLFGTLIGVDIAIFSNWIRHPEIVTLQADLDKGPLPFADQTFDAVTMLMVLEHVFNPFHALREIWRVSKPEARVIIGVPNLASVRHRWTLLRGKLPVTSAWFSFEEEAWDGYHLHNFTQNSLTWLLRREGLQPIRWSSQGRGQLVKRLRPSLFGADFVVLCKKTEPERCLPPRF